MIGTAGGGGGWRECALRPIVGGAEETLPGVEAVPLRGGGGGVAWVLEDLLLEVVERAGVAVERFRSRWARVESSFVRDVGRGGGAMGRGAVDGEEFVGRVGVGRRVCLTDVVGEGATEEEGETSVVSSSSVREERAVWSWVRVDEGRG